MLTYDALQSAIPLSQLAFSKKLTLSAVPNTPLAALYNATSIGPDAETMVVDGGKDVDLGSIANLTNSTFPGSDYVEHDAVFDDIVRVASETIKQQINFAKTVVSPIIQNIVEKTKTALLSGNTSKISMYRVEPYIYPAVFFNTGFESMLESSLGNSDSFDVSPSLRLPNMSLEDIAKLLETGSSSIDKDVANWVSTLGPDFLEKVWRCYFSEEKEFGTTNISLTASFNRPAANSMEPSGYDYATAVYLIANRLSEEPIAGSNMSAADYESALKGYREVAARVITNAINEADLASKNGVLVRSRNEYAVSVNNHVYTEWLKDEQNCLEVLLGLLLENRTMVFVNDINQNRERLCDNWERHVRLVKAAEQAEEHVQIRSLFINYFNMHFKSELNEHPEFAAQVMTACKNFEAELLKFTSDEMRGLWLPATKAVCRAAYPASNAEEILIGMEEASRNNPESDPRELAAIVIVDMAARWVAQQIQVAG